MNRLDGIMSSGQSYLESFAGQTFSKLEERIYVALGRICEHNDMASLVVHFLVYRDGICSVNRRDILIGVLAESPEQIYHEKLCYNIEEVAHCF